MKLPILLLTIFTLPFSVIASDTTAKDFIKQLKSHYKSSQTLDKFSITFSRGFLNSAQSYDFKKPTAATRKQTTEIDLGQQLFYSRTTRSGFPGAFIFDTIDFKNIEGNTYRYDLNGVLYGKQVKEVVSNQYQREVEEAYDIIDIIAIKPLISEDLNVKTVNVTVDDKAKKTKVEYAPSGQDKIIYTFTTDSNKPIKLVSKYIEKDDRLISYGKSVSKNGLLYAGNTIIKTSKRTNEFIIENVQKIVDITLDKLVQPKGHGPIIKAAKKSMEIEMISKDLYVISNVNGNRNIAISIQDNNITVFGAPISDEMSEIVINKIMENFLGKKIKSVYVTHPHSDHIGGLAAYAKRGITILADAYSVEAIKNFAKFKDVIDTFSFYAFKDKEVIDGVRYYVVPNSHAKAQSFAYFQFEKVIYQGDLLEVPFDNTIASYMSKVERKFVEFLKGINLPLKRIIGHHRNANISPEIMYSYYDSNTIVMQRK